MLQRRFFIACLFVLLAGRSFSQVSLQTGSATFSLPVFNWQDNKSRLNTVIALSYNSGNGLKVSDVASSAGQGWSLVAGGVIARMQVGEPDDQVARGTASEYDLTKYPNGILYANTPAYNGCPTALTKYPIYGWKNQLYAQHNAVAEDKQLDYFSFQFNGKAGMFVLDPVEIGKVHPLGDTKMKISFTLDPNLSAQGIRTTITSFTITDVDGLIYKFARHGMAKALQVRYCHPWLEQMRTQPKMEGGKVYYQSAFDNGDIVNPWTINSWYLTEIEDGLTHVKVLFNYHTRFINTYAGADITHTHDAGYSTITHKRTISQTPAIASITYPDGHTVTFNYATADRVDMSGDKALSSIDIDFQGRMISKHLINTSYFILNRYGKPVTDYQKKMARLCLRSVQKIGVDLKEDSPPYQFDYYLGSNAADDFVPPPFSYAKDVWGFYNGNNSVDYDNNPMPLTVPIAELNNSQTKGLCFINVNTPNQVFLNPKAGYAKNGLLRQVIYPTGGTLTWQYTQNYSVLNGTERAVGGVHVSQTGSTDGGYTHDCASPLTTLYNYVLSDGVSSSLWGLEMPVTSMTTQSHYQPEYKYYKYTFPFGSCAWKFQYPGILSQQQIVDLNGFQKVMEAIAPVLGVINVISTIMDVVNVCLSATPLAIVSVVIDIISGLLTLALTCIGDQSRDKSYISLYNMDLNGAAPLPTQFKRVEVVENPGTIGKTVHEFTNSDDYAIWVSSNPNFAAKQRFAPWAYGLPKKATVYNSSGTMLTQTENVYNFSPAKRLIGAQVCGHPGQPCNPSGLASNIVSCKCLVVKSSSQRNTSWADPAEYNNPASYLTSSSNDLKVDFYGMYSGRVELTNSYKRTHQPDNPSQYVQEAVDYTYNTTNYEVSAVTTTDFDGTRRTKQVSYSCDYNTGIFVTMNQKNMVSVPVSTVNSIYKNYAPNSWQTYYLGEETIEYTSLATGDIKPYRTLERRMAQPTTNLSAITPVETQLMYYDGTSNLLGVKSEGGRVVTNLFGHGYKYIVATVVNAHPINDKSFYTSFEESGANGWILAIASGSATHNNSAVTGTRSLILTSSISNIAYIPGDKPYTLSFWASNNSSQVTATGGTATQTIAAPTINGFTYYQYDISASTTMVTVAGGNASIDELRLYPKNARMRSTTYDPLIGKTSECDDNNRVVYYEYDNLGRMRLIRDENRNILEMFEYNNVSKQNGCPGTYYNKLITEVYTKNNCGTGYLGSNVPYSVPANTFSSTISQEHADALAENYLLANGQNHANTNGSCVLIYYNVVQSQNFTYDKCPPGYAYTGPTLTYTVPAGRYSSIISQADANQQALDDIEANGQVWANSQNVTCSSNTDPRWEAPDGAPTRCESVNGNLPPHLFIQATDVNPNSPSYNTTIWIDLGPSAQCPSNTYYNQEQSQGFWNNTCQPDYSGSGIIYTVPAGTYSSTVSQAAANQLALNDIAANGQNYANSNDPCVYACPGCSAMGLQYKCVWGMCDTGVKVYTASWQDGGQWYCQYHYEFSDGSWSTDVVEPSGSQCFF